MTIFENRGGQVYDTVYRSERFDRYMQGLAHAVTVRLLPHQKIETTRRVLRLISLGVFVGKVEVLQSKSPTSKHIRRIQM